MPVRIIFRGLILFRIENEGTAAGRIVAQLIDHDSLQASGGGGRRMAGMPMSGTSMGGMPMGVSPVHHHEAEVQILTGAPGQPLVPGSLARGINLTLSPESNVHAQATPSYRAFVPKLSTVVQQVRTPELMPAKGPRDSNFIRNTITVTRGKIRAKELVSWDSGGFPLDGAKGAGYSATSTVDVRFMSSNYTGRVAGECIIDIDDATSIGVSGDGSPFADNYAAHDGPDHDTQHVARDTVEILIANLPPQRLKPIPWSVHYQWLFRAAGYQPAPFDPAELQAFENAARTYAGTAFDFDGEDLPLFEGGNSGLPFPYLDMPESSGVKAPEDTMGMAADAVLNDPWNRPLCPHGDE